MVVIKDPEAGGFGYKSLDTGTSMDLVHLQDREVASSGRAGRCLSCVCRSMAATREGLLGSDVFSNH